MTSGVPLYLVSACGSAEEFVAAFRRYADRTGLFIPSAAPLPAGRRGRIALTLSDGGVMIEGEAEILQSSSKPTVLHGRPGMTVKFVETDEPSKGMIIELEKARLAMRPAPTSAVPRHASVPAQPRPVVPPTGGRIDAANALAECVVIGDVGSLEATSGPPKSDGKFVVPSIPSMGGRPKTPSVPPGTLPPPTTPVTPVAPTPVAPTPAAPPAKWAMPTSTPNSKMTSIGFPIVDKLPAQTESGKLSNATTLGMPALDRLPAELLEAQVATQIGPPVVPPNKTPVRPIDAQTPVLDAPTVVRPQKFAPTVHDEQTTLGEAPPRKPDPVPGSSGSSGSSGSLNAATGEPMQRRPDPKHKATSIGFPAIRTPFETQAVGVVPPPTKPEPGDPVVSRSSKPRGKGPTTPPLTPRHPTPVAPLPIVRPPAGSPPPNRASGVEAEDEKTELVGVPVEPVTPAPDSGPVYVSSSLPEELPVAQVDLLGPTLITRSGGMRASEIMAAIAPTEDWTMSPDASGPTVMPSMLKDAERAAIEPTPAPGPPPGPPTGDWTISLDPEAGWSEPAKVMPLPASAAAPVAGNPDRVVASDKPFIAVEWEEKPTGIGEAKIEIDPSLMEHKRLRPQDDDGSVKALPPTPTPGPIRPLAPMPPPAPRAGPASNLFGAPPPSIPVPTFDHVTHNVDTLATYPIQGASNAGKKKRTIAIAIGAAVALIAGVVLALVITSGKSKGTTKPAGHATGSAEVVKTGSNAQLGSAVAGSNVETVQAGSAVETGPNVAGSGSAEVAVVAPGSAAGSAETPIDVGTPPPGTGGTCKVTISSLPPGADVLLAANKLGTTPGTFDLPCGAESKLTLKKSRFLNTARSVTPSASKPTKLLVKLGKQMFQVKVTSTPPGATITAGGKTMGVTPTTIKLPGFEPTSITLTKPGFSKDVQRVTPKNNNASHRVTLKKGK